MARSRFIAGAALRQKYRKESCYLRKACFLRRRRKQNLFANRLKLVH
jgi:hypothetical protein